LWITDRSRSSKFRQFSVDVNRIFATKCRFRNFAQEIEFLQRSFVPNPRASANFRISYFPNELDSQVSFSPQTGHLSVCFSGGFNSGTSNFRICRIFVGETLIPGCVLKIRDQMRFLYREYDRNPETAKENCSTIKKFGFLQPIKLVFYKISGTG